MRILAIGAHPDDIELGCGGTMARAAKNGSEVFFLILSFGEMGGVKKDERESEARKSAKILGVKDIIFLGLPDTEIKYEYETISKIEKIIEGIEPNEIYIPTPEDTHQDHRNTALSAITAARNMPLVLSYESPSTFPKFNPQLLVNIEETLPMKVKALKCYISQNKKLYMKIDAIEGLARFRGLQAKVKYAEAFEIIRQVIL